MQSSGGRLPYHAKLDVSRSAKHLVFLTLVSLASSTIMVKAGEVQLLEILFLLFTPLLLLYFLKANFIISLDRFSRYLMIHYLIFLASVCLLALIDLRLPVFMPSEPSLLKKPVLITIARLAELSLAVCFLLFFSQLFKKSQATFRFAARGFYLCGLASVIFSLVSLPIAILWNVDLGAFGDSHRFRGFFNEGGPYGLYLIGVALVGYYLKERGWLSILNWRLSIILISVGFLGTQSKAADLAVLSILLINAMTAATLRLRIGLIVGLGIALVIATIAGNLFYRVGVYVSESAEYELLAAQRPDDVNLVVGRVAALVIVPRMISAHPFTGIGFGNYGLMRNNPDYRGLGPYVEWFDLPGLGLVGYAAELGLPLFLYFTYLLSMPYFHLRSRKAALIIQNLALFQIVASLFGAQLNLYYPWIITSFALAAGWQSRQTTP